MAVPTAPRELNPVLLLDVDGVVNAVSPWPTRDAWPAESWRRLSVEDLNGQRWPILSAEPVVAFLRALDEAGVVEVRWHSTWQHSARRCLAPELDLPDWPVAEAPEFTHRLDSGYVTNRVSSGRWWKAPAAERVVVKEGRRLVWIDDDLRWEVNRDPAVVRLVENQRVLALSPATDVGIAPADIAAINDFLESGAR
ncbi:MAG: hypothetical protein JO147_05780 [Actinobacteria bacterium]|nr:hypothetical protein [Actinomycetota bacterium]